MDEFRCVCEGGGKEGEREGVGRSEWSGSGRRRIRERKVREDERIEFIPPLSIEGHMD